MLIYVYSEQTFIILINIQVYNKSSHSNKFRAYIIKYTMCNLVFNFTLFNIKHIAKNGKFFFVVTPYSDGSVRLRRISYIIPNNR